MLLSCMIAISAMAPTLTVGDFCRLTPGVKRYYQDQVGGQVGAELQEVGEAVKIGDKEVIPVTTSSEGVVGSRMFYAIDGDTLNVMALAAGELLKVPLPVMKVGQGRVQWQFVEQSPVSPRKSFLTVNAESNPRGKRRVLGVEREILEVKFTTESPKGDIPFKLTQTALYAAGIGMCESTTESTVFKKTTKQKLTLTQFVGPKQTG